MILNRILVQILVMKMVFKKKKIMESEDLGNYVFPSLPASFPPSLFDLTIWCPNSELHLRRHNVRGLSKGDPSLSYLAC